MSFPAVYRLNVWITYDRFSCRSELMVDDRESAISALREILLKSFTCSNSGKFKMIAIHREEVDFNPIIGNIPASIVSEIEFARYVYTRLIQKCDPHIKFPKVIEDYNSILFEYRKDGIITQLYLNFSICPSPFNVFVVRIENMNQSWEIRTNITRIPKPSDSPDQIRKFVNDAITENTNIFTTKIFDKLDNGRTLTPSSSSKSSSGSQTPTCIYLG